MCVAPQGESLISKLASVFQLLLRKPSDAGTTSLDSVLTGIIAHKSAATADGEISHGYICSVLKYFLLVDKEWHTVTTALVKGARILAPALNRLAGRSSRRGDATTVEINVKEPEFREELVRRSQIVSLPCFLSVPS